MHALNSFQDSEQFEGDFVAHDVWEIMVTYLITNKGTCFDLLSHTHISRIISHGSTALLEPICCTSTTVPSSMSSRSLFFRRTESTEYTENF